MALQFRYVLTQANAQGGYNAAASEITEIKVATYGSDIEKARQFWLDIYAGGTGADNNKILESVDLSFGLTDLTNIAANDWQASSGFNLFRSTSLGGSLNESILRASQGSAGNLSAGLGNGIILYGQGGLVGRIQLDFNEDATAANGYWSPSIDLSNFVSIALNQDETILGSASQPATRPRSIQSARETGYDINIAGLEGIKVVQALGKFGSFQIQNNIGTSLETNSARVGVGPDEKPLFTNLVREGQTISRDFSFKNDGDATLMRAAWEVNGLTFSDSLENVIRGSGDLGNVGAGDSQTISNSARVKTETAGQIVETGGNIGFTADGNQTTYQVDTIKNLITYQGDLNYDGKVGMRDLAALNEGARLAGQYGSTANEDVDANFDGSINLADLAVLAKDWGATLWTDSGSSATYAGANEVTLDQLASQNDGRQTWDNDPFMTEKTAQEASGFVVSALGAAQAGPTDQNNYFPDQLEGSIYSSNS